MKCRKMNEGKWVYKSRNWGMGPTSQSTPQNYCPQLRWMKMKAQCRRKSSEGKPGRRAKRLMSSFARSGLPILVPAGQVWCRINSRTALRRPIRCRVPDYPQGVRDKGGWFKSGTEVKTGRSSGVLKCSERRSQWVFNSLLEGKLNWGWLGSVQSGSTHTRFILYTIRFLCFLTKVIMGLSTSIDALNNLDCWLKYKSTQMILIIFNFFSS